MATFVLVHGAWHGGWCWRKLRPLLATAGHQVFTPTLTGLGERAHLGSPEIGLATHVADVANVMSYEDLHDVIMVGHSYGGMVISGVAGQQPERLRHLVFFDAYVPRDGESMASLMPQERRAALEARVLAEGDGWRLPSLLPMPWADYVRRYYLVQDEAEVEWLAGRLGPHPYKTWTDPVSMPDPAALDIPRTYIRCSEYRNSAFDRYAEEFRAAGLQSHALPTSHDAMVTMPRELADILLALA